MNDGKEELKSFKHEWTVICGPSFQASKEKDGTRSENFSIINLLASKISKDCRFFIIVSRSSILSINLFKTKLAFFEFIIFSSINSAAFLSIKYFALNN